MDKRGILCKILLLLDDLYNMEVKILPPGSGRLAYYEAPPEDGSRPGTFVAVLGPLQKRYLVSSFTLHEGNPGHHLQAIFRLQQKDVPKFISNPGPSR